MKYLNKILVVCTAALFISCEEDVIVFNTTDGFLQFQTAAVSITEDAPDPLVSQVQYGGESNESGVTVNFTVTSDNPARYQVSPASGTITIPAGEFSAEIVITPVDNFDVDGDIEIVVELLESSSVPLGTGGEGVYLTSRTVTLIDNDCPITIEDWAGTYSVFENFTDGVNAPNGLNNFFGESYQLQFAVLENDPAANKVVVTNAPGFDVYINNGTILEFLTCSGTVTFNGGFPQVALFRVFEYTNSSYDDSSFEIKAEGPLATFGPYQFTFTKL